MPLSKVPALGRCNYSVGRYCGNLVPLLRHPASIPDPIKMRSDLAQVDLSWGVDGFRIKVSTMMQDERMRERTGIDGAC
jgi:hypothetical protein